jgi:hypothetical protein
MQVSGCSPKGLAVLAALCGAAPAAQGATFGEIAGGGSAGGAMMPVYAAGPYATAPGGSCPPDCYRSPSPLYGGPEGALPESAGQAMPYIPPVQANPRAFLPLSGTGDTPNDQLRLWSFGQVNATTDPFDAAGLSTPYMYVPWSTPISGWSNAATWNWWRERSGALPRNW